MIITNLQSTTKLKSKCNKLDDDDDDDGDDDDFWISIDP